MSGKKKKYLTAAQIRLGSAPMVQELTGLVWAMRPRSCPMYGTPTRTARWRSGACRRRPECWRGRRGNVVAKAARAAV